MTEECQGWRRPEWAGPIGYVVVATPDLAASVAAYRDGLGWRVRERGALAPAVAAAWSVPDLAGSGYAVVGPDSRVGGDVWLVAVPGPPATPLRRRGWAALEVCVADVDATVDRLAGHVTVRGAPAALSGPAAALRAAQVAGPAGEVIYLTEIRRPVPPFQLPVPSAGPAADGVFMALLATGDLEPTRAWWERRFPVRRCTDRRATIGILNREYGLPADTTTRISTLQLSGRCLVEIDQYPAAAAPGPSGAGTSRSGMLPAGIALVAIGVPSERSSGAGAPSEQGAGKANGGQTVIEGPEGALISLVPAPQPIDLV